MKKHEILICTVTPTGLNEYQVIALRNKVRYKLTVNEVGYIRAAEKILTQEPIPLVILIEFFEPVSTAMIQFHNNFFLPIELTPQIKRQRKPFMKRKKYSMKALCKKKNSLETVVVEGNYPHKKAFQTRLLKQGYEVKHIYIA